MGVDILEIPKGLLQAFLLGAHRSVTTGRQQRLGSGGCILGFLKILQHATRKGAEGLQCSPVQFLLLTQAWVFPDQTVMFPVKPLTVRALAGLFGHRVPLVKQRPSWHPLGGCPVVLCFA